MLLSQVGDNKNKDPWYKKTWRNLNLLVGNSRRFNCQSRRYKRKIVLAITTFYLFMFTLGLFAGDLVGSNIINIERLLGMFSTAVVYSLGFSIIQEYWRGKDSALATVVALALIGSQTAYVFNLFPVAVTNIFYYFASIVTMLFTYTLVHKDRIARLKSENNSQKGFIKL